MKIQPKRIQQIGTTFNRIHSNNAAIQSMRNAAIQSNYSDNTYSSSQKRSLWIASSPDSMALHDAYTAAQAFAKDSEKYYKSHADFYSSSVKSLEWSNDDITLFKNLAKRHCKPSLMNHAEKLKIFDHALPKQNAMAANGNVIINFNNTNWYSAHGHPISPEFTTNNPQVTILSDSPNTTHFSLMMIDLDRPHLPTNSYEQWCHWLITDIPVNKSTVIPSLPSPYLDSSVESKLPGNVVFDYVPPHPTFSNPKKPHRMLLVCWEQSTEKLDIDTSLWTSEAEKQREIEMKSSAPSFKKMYEGPGELKLKVRERGCFLPLMKFEKDFNLKLHSFGFFTTSWNLESSKIMSDLGVHEPVFAKLQDDKVPQLITQISNSTKLAQTLPSDMKNISKSTYNLLNKGIATMKPINYLPTEKDIEASKISIKNPYIPKQKNQRLTMLGAVAVVKNKTNDVAHTFVGDETKASKVRRFRYENA
ncbi:phosphatidylethanolamine-binding protein [Globomyces pollinis-pini]|nr:phosphatidylethanolamine-binding protein [Globomyces pollinis-pini]